MCPTCGLPLPPRVRGRGPRRFCTDACRLHQHRYPRARVRITQLTKSAIGSEQLERPDMAEREWALVGIALDRLAGMTEMIRGARSEVGLSVPPEWPFEDASADVLADVQIWAGGPRDPK